MKIWYLHNYTMLPEHGTLNRGYYLGKYWKKMGHDPVVFAGSHPHNTDLQLINEKKPYILYRNTPFMWVLIRTRKYGRSRKQQIISMIEYYFRCKKAARELTGEHTDNHSGIYGKPDAIVGSSAHPLAALLAIKLAKKYGCIAVVEIRDLWPESIVDYGVLKRNNPVVKMMYCFEKYLYVHADKIIFTQEGAYRYIEEKSWNDVIPAEKVGFVSNGTDTEEFLYNLEHYVMKDEDLDDPNTFKVIYTGAIKLVNGIGKLIDVAKEIKDKRVKILIWGDGDELEELEQRIRDEEISNVVFKGRVDKRYIPSILSKGDLELMHVRQQGILRFGFSPNKLYDYMMAGRPILVDCRTYNNPVLRYKAGKETDINNPKAVAEAIEEFLNISNQEYLKYCENSKKGAGEYSYECLAKKYIEYIS